MNKEEIIKMARQAGFVDYELDDGTTNAFDKRYEAFAKLIAEKEREACAECGVNGNHALYCVACAEKYLEDKNTKGQK